jgi:hypothetical protein
VFVLLVSVFVYKFKIWYFGSIKVNLYVVKASLDVVTLFLKCVEKKGLVEDNVFFQKNKVFSLFLWTNLELTDFHNLRLETFFHGYLTVFLSELSPNSLVIFGYVINKRKKRVFCL